MRLALRLGCTLRELLARIGSDELALWEAFDRVEPFEDGYWQAGVIASTIVNANPIAPPKRAFTPEDFLPVRRPAAKAPTPRKSPKELMAIMGTVAKVQGAGASASTGRHKGI